jgi:hypothetical protein
MIHATTIMSLTCSTIEALKIDHPQSLESALSLLTLACVVQLLCFIGVEEIGWIFVTPIILWYCSKPLSIIGKQIFEPGF